MKRVRCGEPTLLPTALVDEAWLEFARHGQDIEGRVVDASQRAAQIEWHPARAYPCHVPDHAATR
ncbi:MAG TPA: hypothetical protein VFZ65_23815 [Planctomycetota bacterium]|nr:hypothetical protein [Planctomycetota bacterium]